ncbi:DEAD/DEAH box helicase [Parerythrobacter jejuensis]|uniref:DEAD/DEAH box helicase n=1 Tax=Parerythrobacter jejuensis TaxID=795812 RepID=A0A845ALC6_9SPHN|nr:DEAD/DEAH box helicase [Parerythrobacter jejuensis]MXP30404.1 DEAD/DEAH box helicase [Parerythrobacter jejuensis]MXP33164.1 DEAD/DEAH box helicase [Parerythrobacter jejuensis]
MTFQNVPPVLGDALAERGYTELTAVQSAVTEPKAMGRDLIVSAQTGSGKTVAFGLALADLLVTDQGLARYADAPQALVIAPTRELALQVSRELRWLYAKVGISIATCVGGMDASKERRALRSAPGIVVGTPGRLCDHLSRGALDLSCLTGIVLDEADEMLDMGFREDLETLLEAAPETRRTLLFSATMPRPIEAMAKRYQNDALRLSLAGQDRGHGDIQYQAVTVQQNEIEHAVVNLLRFHEAETAILFCATRDNVRHLHATLQERGFTAVALSGEHSQTERNQALQALRDRRVRVCVATDVAARGIDLPTLTLVIHVEIPQNAEVLQHRSGRTGRAGKKGTAVIVVPHRRRKRVESMLRGAKVKADWIEAPTPEQIRKNDHARLLEALKQPVEFEDEDRALAQELMAEKSPEDIAAALVRAHRAKMPAPEEVTPDTPEARKAAQQKGHRAGFEDIVWFRMPIGRRDNADPRWILPLICRRGDITKNEIGAIRIGQGETYFQIPRGLADRFADAAERTGAQATERDAVLIEPSAEGPREAARQNRRGGKPGTAHVRPRHPGNRGAGPARGPERSWGKDRPAHKGGKRFEKREDRSDAPKSRGTGFKGKPQKFGGASDKAAPGKFGSAAGKPMGKGPSKGPGKNKGKPKRFTKARQD